MTRIVTLTMNPAVDVSTTTRKVQPVHKLRCGPAAVHPGGGGINVARVLARLGSSVLAIHTAGGTTGAQLGQLLEAEGVPARAVPIAGETRESFSVHEEESGNDFRFVLPGPTLSSGEAEACLAAVRAAPADAGCLVLSGSLPPGVPVRFYADLAEEARQRGLQVALDTSGPALAAAVQAGVWLVKPSRRELGELVGETLDTPARQLAACRDLIGHGKAQVVALSLGDQGALLVTQAQAWRAPALRVEVASTIGAGDSFLAGLLHGLLCGQAVDQAFRLAMACSAAALLGGGTALCRPEDVERLKAQVALAPA